MPDWIYLYSVNLLRSKTKKNLKKLPSKTDPKSVGDETMMGGQTSLSGSGLIPS
jgi:hypothetical protein